MSFINKFRLKLYKKYINDDVFIKWKELKNAVDNAEKPELLIAGSSHGVCGIIGSVIAHNSLNICFDSIDLYLTNKLAQYYINKFGSVKTLIITYSLFSNSYELERIKGIRSILDGLEVFLNIKGRKKYTSKDRLRICGVKDYKRNFIDTINADSKYREINGDQKELQPYDAPAATETVNNHIKHYKRNISQNIYVEKLLEFCLEKGIEVFIVITPVRDDYKKIVMQECDMDNLFMDIKNICTRYKNAHLLSYFLSEEFTPDEYRDADHINMKGAKKLSNFIKYDIEKFYGNSK